jgi:hypothetical protein
MEIFIDAQQYLKGKDRNWCKGRVRTEVHRQHDGTYWYNDQIKRPASLQKFCSSCATLTNVIPFGL